MISACQYQFEDFLVIFYGLGDAILAHFQHTMPRIMELEIGVIDDLPIHLDRSLRDQPPRFTRRLCKLNFVNDKPANPNRLGRHELDANIRGRRSLLKSSLEILSCRLRCNSTVKPGDEFHTERLLNVHRMESSRF